MTSIPTSAAPNIATAPRQKAPKGAVDTHIHMLAAADEFALSPTRVQNPVAGLDMDGFIALYKTQMETLGISRTVVVHSIVYGSDNSVTLEAIERLGRNDTRGIGLLKDGATEAEVEALARAGVKGIRINYVHGGILTWDGAKALAPMLKARDMHIQMLVNTEKHLTDLAPDIRELDVPVVFDHIGWPDLSKGPQDTGFQALCDLMKDGHAYTKLSGLYRLDAAPFSQTDPFVAALVAANPERCLWASDWPYIMLAEAEMSEAGIMLDAFDRVVPAKVRAQILVDNPTSLYGFDPL
jgi:predicted TIM-barrel fold metal-dependent hydrolase